MQNKWLLVGNAVCNSFTNAFSSSDPVTMQSTTFSSDACSSVSKNPRKITKHVKYVTKVPSSWRNTGPRKTGGCIVLARNTELFLNTVTVRNSELTLNVLSTHNMVSGALDLQKHLISFNCSSVKRTHGACPDVKDVSYKLVLCHLWTQSFHLVCSVVGTVAVWAIRFDVNCTLDILNLFQITGTLVFISFVRCQFGIYLRGLHFFHICPWLRLKRQTVYERTLIHYVYCYRDSLHYQETYQVLA